MKNTSALFSDELKMISGATAPYFDRLISHNSEEQGDEDKQSFLDYDAFLASIKHEIALILNTRSSARKYFYNQFEGDPLIFGLPALFGLNDFQSFDVSSARDRKKISLVCEEVIKVYEPRLLETKVVAKKPCKFLQKKYSLRWVGGWKSCFKRLLTEV